MKDVILHRLNLKTELLKVFQQDDILEYGLRFSLIDPRGQEEYGSGDGVSRDVFCSFFNEFLASYTLGRQDKVPAIRHDMSKMQWQAVARILLYGLKVDYFPLSLSPAFLLAALFGEGCVTDDLLLSSFKNYISIEEKDNINEMLTNFEENNQDLLDTLSSYNCYRLPTKESLKDVVLELAHQEIIQKPRYVANCFAEIFSVSTCEAPLKSDKNLLQYYAKRIPSAKKVIKCLVTTSDMSDSERNTLNHLTRYIKSLAGTELERFLHFVTGGNIVPDKIQVEFQLQETRAPRARTCVPQLELCNSYSCYNELAEEFSHILKAADSFLFSFI